MKTFIKISTVLIVISFIITGVAKADMAPPSYQTTFNFQQNGQPFNSPVKFTVTCYGTGAYDDTTLLKISEFSNTCQNYGCAFDTSDIFETYRQNTKYCDLTAQVNGQQFVKKNFVDSSLNGLNCQNADFQSYDGSKYIKETAGFQACNDQALAQYPATDCYQYLTPATPSKYSMELDGKYYNIGDQFYACTGELDAKIKQACQQYLVDVTSTLVKDANGEPYDKLCVADINVPANIPNVSTQQQAVATSSVTNPPAQAINPTPAASVLPVRQPGFFTRMFSSIACFFRGLFGKSC